MTEPEAYNRLRFLDNIERTSYAEKGRICLEVKSKLSHHQRIDPESGQPCTLTRWVRLAAPWGYASCFSAMRDMEALTDVSAKDLARIPEANIKLLTQLSTAVRNDPKVIQAAKTQRAPQFIEQVKRDHPGQHISKPEIVRFTVSESEAIIIEEVIKDLMETGLTKSQALVSLCVSYWVEKTSRESAKEVQ